MKNVIELWEPSMLNVFNQIEMDSSISASHKVQNALLEN